MDSSNRWAMVGGTGVCSASCRSISSTLANSRADDDCVCCCVGRELFLLLLGKFGLTFHTWTSSGLLEQGGESLAGAVELASHRVGGLFSQRADLFIAQLFVGHQQQQQPIFRGQPIERF